MAQVYLSTGTNLGDRLQHLIDVKLALESTFKIIAVSAIYETEPWGFEASQNFYNQVICIETDIEPFALMTKLLEIEQKLGRTRTKALSQQYESRVIDIDILFYDNKIIDTPQLTVPHPKLHERLFVLVPLAEIASDFVHPIFNTTFEQLLQNCLDKNTPSKVSF